MHQFVISKQNVICACTGPVATSLGAVYVGCGGQTWPNKMSTDTKIQTKTEKRIQDTPPSYAIRYETAYPWKTNRKGSRFKLRKPS